jgi:hypothetical protein
MPDCSDRLRHVTRDATARTGRKGEGTAIAVMPKSLR